MKSFLSQQGTKHRLKAFPIFSLMNFQTVKAELTLVFHLHLSPRDGVRQNPRVPGWKGPQGPPGPTFPGAGGIEMSRPSSLASWVPKVPRAGECREVMSAATVHRFTNASGGAPGNFVVSNHQLHTSERTLSVCYLHLHPALVQMLPLLLCLCTCPCPCRFLHRGSSQGLAPHLQMQVDEFCCTAEPLKV